MGRLDHGEWRDVGYDTDAHEGRFERERSKFRNWITTDGAPGPSGEGGFVAEPGRYHLYVSWACPWSHRCLIFRQLKGLQDLVPMSVTHWLMGEQGWTFEPAPGVIADSANHTQRIHEIYCKADPGYSGPTSVPVLWDRQRETIVSNESADIIRMFNSAFDAVGATPGDYYPQLLREQIDGVNERVYKTFNNGVYRAGFASTQEAYDEAVGPIFETLDWMDARLSTQRYLCGGQLTEADWRAFCTLIRFDAVYHGHFKCNLRRIVDYPHLWPYLRELYQHGEIAETVNFHHIKHHYYCSHRDINANGIVPAGPLLDLDRAHGRELV